MRSQRKTRCYIITKLSSLTNEGIKEIFSILSTDSEYIREMFTLNVIINVWNLISTFSYHSVRPEKLGYPFNQKYEIRRKVISRFKSLGYRVTVNFLPTLSRRAKPLSQTLNRSGWVKSLKLRFVSRLIWTTTILRKVNGGQNRENTFQNEGYSLFKFDSYTYQGFECSCRNSVSRSISPRCSPDREGRGQVLFWKLPILYSYSKGQISILHWILLSEE